MAPGTVNYTQTVANMLRFSTLAPQRQEDLYQGFLGNDQVVPEAFRNDWQTLIRLGDGNGNQELVSAAQQVPVAWDADVPESGAAAGVEQSYAQYLGIQEGEGGAEAVWAGAVLMAGRERLDWLDKGVAYYLQSILKPEIKASTELSAEIVGRVLAVLTKEFEALSKLLDVIGNLESALDRASSSSVTKGMITGFENMARTIRDGDERFTELLLETASVERYEDLIHPDRRYWVVNELRHQLWAGAPRVDTKSETPIAELFEAGVNYVSRRADKVLGYASGFGITV